MAGLFGWDGRDIGEEGGLAKKTAGNTNRIALPAHPKGQAGGI